MGWELLTVKVSERLRNLFVKESFANMDVVEKYSEALGCCESDSDVAAFAGMLSRAKEIDLLGSDDEGHRVRVAIQSSDPVVLAMCARDFESDIRAIAARNPRLTDGAALFDLARDEHYKVRCAVAGRDDIPFDMRVMLMGDENYMVRAAAVEGAREYGFARLVVRALFEDKSRMVQAAAARNPLLPSDLAEALLSCGIKEVERSDARNPGLSTSLLSQLTKSDREHVRAGALANVSTAQSDMAEAALGEKMGEKVVDDAAAVIVAGNENVDVATAYVIADSGSAEARRILAGNEGNGLYSALYLIASCRDDVVARRACAANPRATMDTLVPLVLDDDNVVRREAVANLIRRRL